MEHDIIWEIAGNLVRKGERVKIRLSGYSMYPQLRPGDYAVIIKVEFKEIKPGDIVAFRYRSDYVLHRVIKKKQDTIICKGDAKHKCDSPVSEGDIIGLLVNALRGNKIVYEMNDKYSFIASKILRFSFFYALKAKVLLKLLILFRYRF